MQYYNASTFFGTGILYNSKKPLANFFWGTRYHLQLVNQSSGVGIGSQVQVLVVKSGDWS